MTPNERSHQPDDLLNSAEVARLLRLSVPTLERMRCQGTGPAYIKLGNGRRARVVYRRDDIEAWLRALRFEKTDQYTTR